MHKHKITKFNIKHVTTSNIRNEYSYWQAFNHYETSKMFNCLWGAVKAKRGGWHPTFIGQLVDFCNFNVFYGPRSIGKLWLDKRNLATFCSSLLFNIFESTYFFTWKVVLYFKISAQFNSLLYILFLSMPELVLVETGIFLTPSRCSEGPLVRIFGPIGLIPEDPLVWRPVG